MPFSCRNQKKNWEKTHTHSRTGCWSFLSQTCSLVVFTAVRISFSLFQMCAYSKIFLCPCFCSCLFSFCLLSFSFFFFISSLFTVIHVLCASVCVSLVWKINHANFLFTIFLSRSSLVCFFIILFYFYLLFWGRKLAMVVISVVLSDEWQRTNLCSDFICYPKSLLYIEFVFAFAIDSPGNREGTECRSVEILWSKSLNYLTDIFVKFSYGFSYQTILETRLYEKYETSKTTYFWWRYHARVYNNMTIVYRII